MKQYLIIRGLLATGAILLTGCGGGDDGSGNGGAAQAPTGSEDATAIETTVTTSSRSRAEFVRLANRICDKDDARRPTEISEYLSNQDDGPTGLAAVIDAFQAVIVPKIPARIEKIRALGAPDGDEQQIEALLVSFQGIVNASSGGLRKALRRSADLAHAYGLHKCAYLL